MRSDTKTIISALRTLANDIQSDDGVANECCREAAGRLEDIDAAVISLYGMVGTAYDEGMRDAYIHMNENTLSEEELCNEIDVSWCDSKAGQYRHLFKSFAGE